MFNETLVPVEGASITAMFQSLRYWKCVKERATRQVFEAAPFQKPEMFQQETFISMRKRNVSI